MGKWYWLFPLISYLQNTKLVLNYDDYAHLSSGPQSSNCRHYEGIIEKLSLNTRSVLISSKTLRPACVQGSKGSTNTVGEHWFRNQEHRGAWWRWVAFCEALIKVSTPEFLQCFAIQRSLPMWSWGGRKPANGSCSYRGDPRVVHRNWKSKY